MLSDKLYVFGLRVRRPRTFANSDPHAYSYSDSNADSDAYPHSDADSNADAYSYANSNAYSYADSDRYSCAFSHAVSGRGGAFDYGLFAFDVEHFFLHRYWPLVPERFFVLRRGQRCFNVSERYDFQYDDVLF